MLIDKFINSEKRVRVSGGNKHCFLFEDYVLLQYSFKEDIIKQEIQIGQALQARGVAVVPILEYRIIDEQNKNGRTKGYVLQPRARGNWLYNRKMENAEYRKRLADIAGMSPQKLNKFISDWVEIRRAELDIDPSKAENFFYSDGNISFIDLSLHPRPINLKEIFIEITEVLTGLGLRYINGGTNVDDCIKIAKNTAHAFVDKGLLSPQDISDILHSKYQTLFSKPQIDNIIAEINQIANIRSQHILNNSLDR